MPRVRAVRLHGMRDVRLDRIDAPPAPGAVDVRAVTRANLSVVGSLGSTRTVWDRTLKLIRARRLPVERVVTSRIPCTEIVERGFAALACPSTDELKVLVSLDEAAPTTA